MLQSLRVCSLQSKRAELLYCHTSWSTGKYTGREEASGTYVSPWYQRVILQSKAGVREGHSGHVKGILGNWARHHKYAGQRHVLVPSE